MHAKGTAVGNYASDPNLYIEEGATIEITVKEDEPCIQRETFHETKH